MMYVLMCGIYWCMVYNDVKVFIFSSSYIIPFNVQQQIRTIKLKELHLVMATI